MQKKFSQINWNQELASKTTIQMWDTFIQHYNWVVSECVPIISSRRKQVKEKWMTKQVKVLILEKEDAWRRSKTSVKENVTRLRAPEGTLTKGDKETAQVMNKAFNGVFVQEDMSIPVPVLGDTPSEGEITTIEFDEDVVRQQLDKLDASKAPGPDGVSPYLFKTCATLLHRPLTRIF
ncbi:hypothetical protein Pcinc_016461 [Petrolisthes cinctipes]|uniref:Uncharacterized protein n=1 Tax=Petrolisthes cinctipes TaxID=88211 RepID=A0AAE1KPH4_PETCI|nr:hypothetical protein Pcinc_016461 [Petrolisthes cinctipes]